MAYEAKPGSFSLFKNDRKANESQPDYKGDGKDLNGNDVWVSAWLKQGSKGEFFSCSLQLKADKPQQQPTQKAAPQKQSRDSDDIPF
jgi:hypothetical protein